MKPKSYCIILIILISSNSCKTSNGFYVLSKESKEALIGVKLKSLNDGEIKGIGDINGYIKIESINSELNESLECQYTGYKSIIISRNDLLALDSILLEELQMDQTLGTTGILPYRQTRFYINSVAHKTNNSDKIGRETEIKKLLERVNNFYHEDYGDIIISFEVDENGNVMNFELLEYTFQPMKKLEQLKLQLKQEVMNKNIQLGKQAQHNGPRGNLKTIKYTFPLKMN